MNLAHLHLLLNHVPTVGFAAALAVLVFGLFERDERQQRAGLGLLFGVALLSLPTYLSGVAASEVLQKSPGVSSTLIRVHEDAALSAFAMIELAGAAAWLALWQFRRFPRQPRTMIVCVLFLSAIAFGLMAQAANLGGAIRHPEILAAQEPVEPVINTAVIATSSIRSFVNDNNWVWPALEALHFIGLGLSFGVVLLLNLRLLGMMKRVAYADLHRMLPWGLLGFGVNLITGMMFFIGVPAQYTTNVSFHWKMICLILLGANLLYLTSIGQAWKVGEGQDAPSLAKVVAVSTIVLWLGVVYFGRMLPYIGGAY